LCQSILSGIIKESKGRDWIHPVKAPTCFRRTWGLEFEFNSSRDWKSEYQHLETTEEEERWSSLNPLQLSTLSQSFSSILLLLVRTPSTLVELPPLKYQATTCYFTPLDCRIDTEEQGMKCVQ
jgi:hypothetical protein